MGKPEKLESVNELAKPIQGMQKEREEACLVSVEPKLKMRLNCWPVTNIRKRLVWICQAAVVVSEGAIPEADGETGALESALDTFAFANASAVLVDAAGQKSGLFCLSRSV